MTTEVVSFEIKGLEDFTKSVKALADASGAFARIHDEKRQDSVEARERREQAKSIKDKERLDKQEQAAQAKKIKEMEKAAREDAAALKKMNAQYNKAAEEQWKALGKIMSVGSSIIKGAFRLVTSVLKTFASVIGSVLGAFMKVPGVIAKAMTDLWAFAQQLTGGMRTSRAVGANVQDIKRLNNWLSPVVNAGDKMKAMAEEKNAPYSLLMTMMGGKRTEKTEDLMLKSMEFAWQKVHDPKGLGASEITRSTYGLQMYSIEDLEALLNTSYEELQTLIEGSQKSRGKGAEKEFNWQLFVAEVSQAFTDIETKIANSLVKILDPLKNLGKAITNQLEKLAGGDVIDALVSKLKEWIEQLTNWLNKPDTSAMIEKWWKEAVATTKTVWHEAEEAIKSFYKWVHAVDWKGIGASIAEFGEILMGAVKWMKTEYTSLFGEGEDKDRATAFLESHGGMSMAEWAKVQSGAGGPSLPYSDEMSYLYRRNQQWNNEAEEARNPIYGQDSAAGFYYKQFKNKDYLGTYKQESGKERSIYNVHQFDSLLRKYATKEVPYEELKAVMLAESNGNPTVESGAGARGLMQIMPSTGAMYEKNANLYDPETSIRIGSKYLAQIHGNKKLNSENDRYAAYNAGEGGRENHGGTWPQESRNYSELVRAVRSQLVKVDVKSDITANPTAQSTQQTGSGGP